MLKRLLKTLLLPLFTSILLILSLSLIGFEVTILSEIDLLPFSLNKTIEPHNGSDARIVILEKNGTPYILKQIENPLLCEQYLLIIDCITSTMATNLGIPVNKVYFVPYNIGNHLKTYPDYAATLHEYIPGNDLESIRPSHLPHYFSLQQIEINPQRQDNNYGSACHLKTVIDSFTQHKDTAAIAALDTFIGNIDRSFQNIFYNHSTDKFYGIDQAGAFRGNLAESMLHTLKTYHHHYLIHNILKTIIPGLSIYAQKLTELCQQYPPESILNAISDLIPYLHREADINEHISNVCTIQYRCMLDNYIHSKKIITILDHYINHDKLVAITEKQFNKDSNEKSYYTYVYCH